MVNWNDPVNISLENFGFIKVEYFVLGILTWEILSTLYFDWQFIAGKRVFKWPYLLYIGARFSSSAALATSLVGLDITTRFNCQAWVRLEYIGGVLGVASGSALLALRTTAIWNNNRIVVGLVIIIWTSSLSFLIYAATQGHSRWDPEQKECHFDLTTNNFIIVLVTLCTDLALLTIMLFQVWHNRKGGKLWNLVYRQGILWVVGASTGGLPGIILLSFNFNTAMNQLLLPFGYLVAGLCATTMYRDLCEYANPVTSIWQCPSIDISPLKSESHTSRPDTANIDLQIAVQPSDEVCKIRSLLVVTQPISTLSSLPNHRMR